MDMRHKACKVKEEDSYDGNAVLACSHISEMVRRSKKQQSVREMCGNWNSLLEGVDQWVLKCFGSMERKVDKTMIKRIYGT